MQQQYQNDIYSQYKEQSVNTMTQGELIVCLYDEAIKRLNRARILAANDENERFDAEVQRAREIVMYLDNNLNRKMPISADLHRMYDYFAYELARAKAGRNVEPVDDIQPMLEELRDAWKQADILSRKAR